MKYRRNIQDRKISGDFAKIRRHLARNTVSKVHRFPEGWTHQIIYIYISRLIAYVTIGSVALVFEHGCLLKTVSHALLYA